MSFATIICCLSAATVLCLSNVAFAQMPAYTKAGPIPPALTAAKTIFVSNGGSDSGLFPEPFTGDPDRPYSEFYAALAVNRSFTLVPDPAQADLVLELRLVAPYGPTNPSKQYGASDPLPMFRLEIYDGKTHYLLWTVTSSIDIAVLQKTHDRNFDIALANVLGRFLEIAGKLPVPAH